MLPHQYESVKLSRSTDHSGLLSVLPSHASTSEASSPVSAASPSMPDIIQCEICLTEFSGEYRKGNLARHVRLKHKDKHSMSYECEDEYCSRTFKRQDARLKHHRKHHPYLDPKPIVLRGRQSSRRPSYSQTPVSEQELQEQDLANVSTWTGYLN